MAVGTATLDFGSTPADEASVAVTGQAGILTTSHVEAFFMQETTSDHGVDEHAEAAALCPLICSDLIAGTGFTIRAHPLAMLGTGTFKVRWVWA
jgi:hypothetical protein